MRGPYKGRVYDPCCGSGGMFVQSLKFIDAHNGQRNQITVYGQESNRTWRMARMNLALPLTTHVNPIESLFRARGHSTFVAWPRN